MESKNRESTREKKDKKESEVMFSCTYCKTFGKIEKHSVYKCSELQKLDVKMRSEWAKTNRICYLCLQQHKPNECKSKYSCKFCDKKHNTLLHFEMKKTTQELKNALCVKTSEEQSNEETMKMMNHQL